MVEDGSFFKRDVLGIPLVPKPYDFAESFGNRPAVVRRDLTKDRSPRFGFFDGFKEALQVLNMFSQVGAYWGKRHSIQECLAWNFGEKVHCSSERSEPPLV